MKRRRFLKLTAVLGALTAGVGAVVAKLSNDSEVLSSEVSQTVTVTADPTELTLAPGETAMVMVSVDPASDYGVGSVCVSVTVPSPWDGTIEGDYSGTVPAGQHYHITGDVNLTGDLYVEGSITGIDTFHLQGNGFTVFFQNGGQADLHGKVKASWGPWGTDTTGWVVGDRLGIAPTAVGKYVPSEVVWSDWSASRPVNSPDVTLVDGSVRKPAVVNLSQSIVFENLARGFHFHDSAGVQSLSDVKFLNCGTTGVLGNYPCHFHLLGDNSRGSLLERVVVEGGKNHAFVPHGSHGIIFQDCVAYKTVNGDVYWWDPPDGDPLNSSNDIAYLHCLALGMANSKTRGAAFHLGSGSNNRCIDSVAAGFTELQFRSGFHWPEMAQSVWEFSGCTAHNIQADGIFTWQNSSNPDHLIADFTAYNCGKAGVEHGAYQNGYHYDGAVITGGPRSVILHALTKNDLTLRFDNVRSDKPLEVTRHQATFNQPTLIRNCQFPSVMYTEMNNGGVNPSWIKYEDCGLVPAQFTLTGIMPTSIIEVYEAGLLTHRWAAGVWS